MPITPDDLRQFTGSERLIRHGFHRSILYTEGVEYFAKEAGAFWFLDILVTEPAILTAQREFAAITMTVVDSKATIVVDDGGKYNPETDSSDPFIFYRREIDWTSCPDGVWKFYFYNNTILLPSEY